MKVGDLVRITNEKGSWKRPRVSLALVDRWVNTPKGWREGHWLYKDPVSKQLFTAEDAISIEKVSSGPFTIL